MAASKEISAVIGSLFGMISFRTVNGGLKESQQLSLWRLVARRAEARIEFATAQAIIWRELDS
jgi:hypothetical protein